jgi:hypothetical protein
MHYPSLTSEGECGGLGVWKWWSPYRIHDKAKSLLLRLRIVMTEIGSLRMDGVSEPSCKSAAFVH